MDIKDVKVGDRCWVAWSYTDGTTLRMDDDGTNATVTIIENKTIRVNTCSSTFTPGVDVFWRKPEAPPKPKRKVTKTYTGWMTMDGVRSLSEVPEDSHGYARWVLHLWRDKDYGSPHKATITVEVEE